MLRLLQRDGVFFRVPSGAVVTLARAALRGAIGRLMPVGDSPARSGSGRFQRLTSQGRLCGQSGDQVARA